MNRRKFLQGILAGTVLSTPLIVFTKVKPKYNTVIQSIQYPTHLITLKVISPDRQHKIQVMMSQEFLQDVTATKQVSASEVISQHLMTLDISSMDDEALIKELTEFVSNLPNKPLTVI